MASLKTGLFLGVCLSAWIITTADLVPHAENVKWVSLDFKTTLTWTTKPSDHKYTVSFSSDDGDSYDSLDCIRVSATECDLTEDIKAIDRTYTAVIKTEPATTDYDYDFEEFPHSFSSPFNPYRESNISAVNFTVEVVDETSVIINITDTLSGIHAHRKQLSIRDILKNDLKYKINYYKSGSTGKKDITSDSTTKEVLGLDAGYSYCFMVAAFIPSRPREAQQGAWSIQQCTPGGDDILHDLSLGAWVGIVFILLTILIIIITVTVLCCRCCRQKNTSQTSAPI